MKLIIKSKYNSNNLGLVEIINDFGIKLGYLIDQLNN